jgi:hypothetical protein
MLAILYRVAKNTPILLAANREESFARPTQFPKIQPGTPRVVCGLDRQANGTWLGVNQFGVLIVATNRPKRYIPLEPRSRGLLARDLLEMRTAREAAEHARKELALGLYAGANYLCADGKYAGVVYGGNRVQIVDLEPGLHTLSNGDLNDANDDRQAYIRRALTLHTLDSAVTFLAVASRAFSRKADSEGRRGIVLTGGEFGTVSSTLLSLPRKIQQSIFQYSDGPPSDRGYEDLSALLRQVLSAGRSRKAAAPGEKKAGAPAPTDRAATAPEKKPGVSKASGMKMPGAKVGSKNGTSKKEESDGLQKTTLGKGPKQVTGGD